MPNPASAINARTARLALPLTFLAGTAALAAGQAAPETSAGAALASVGDMIREQLRARSVDAAAETSMATYFPTALSAESLDHKVARALSLKGFTKQNTVLATSACPDDVNSKRGELIDTLRKRWGENVALGGLGGLPFAGAETFGISSDGGKLLIFFAPHVGVDEKTGAVGFLQRDSRNELSVDCDAALGAFKLLRSGADASAADENDIGDAQTTAIKLALKDRLGNVDAASNEAAYVTYKMYALVRDMFSDILSEAALWDDTTEVAVLGGIMVNRAQGGDRFQPLMLQTRKVELGSTVDLFQSTFGAYPDLREALVTKEEVDEIKRLPVEKPTRLPQTSSSSSIAPDAATPPSPAPPAQTLEPPKSESPEAQSQLQSSKIASPAADPPPPAAEAPAASAPAPPSLFSPAPAPEAKPEAESAPSLFELYGEPTAKPPMSAPSQPATAPPAPTFKFSPPASPPADEVAPAPEPETESKSPFSFFSSPSPPAEVAPAPEPEAESKSPFSFFSPPSPPAEVAPAPEPEAESKSPFSFFSPPSPPAEVAPAPAPSKSPFSFFSPPSPPAEVAPETEPKSPFSLFAPPSAPSAEESVPSVPEVAPPAAAPSPPPSTFESDTAAAASAVAAAAAAAGSTAAETATAAAETASAAASATAAAASKLPFDLEAAKKFGVPEDVYNALATLYRPEGDLKDSLTSVGALGLYAGVAAGVVPASLLGSLRSFILFCRRRKQEGL